MPVSAVCQSLFCYHRHHLHQHCHHQPHLLYRCITVVCDSTCIAGWHRSPAESGQFQCSSATSRILFRFLLFSFCCFLIFTAQLFRLLTQLSLWSLITHTSNLSTSTTNQQQINCRSTHRIKAPPPVSIGKMSFKKIFRKSKKTDDGMNYVVSSHYQPVSGSWWEKSARCWCCCWCWCYTRASQLPLVTCPLAVEWLTGWLTSHSGWLSLVLVCEHHQLQQFALLLSVSDTVFLCVGLSQCVYVFLAYQWLYRLCRLSRRPPPPPKLVVACSLQ